INWPLDCASRTTRVRRLYGRDRRKSFSDWLLLPMFKLILHTKATYSIYNKNTYNFNKTSFIIGKILA
ncbi:hypothetical protein BU23DRAFT_483657, partial [Bimuria novae-zelandiae CBS 107.79]